MVGFLSLFKTPELDALGVVFSQNIIIVLICFQKEDKCC